MLPFEELSQTRKALQSKFEKEYMKSRQFLPLFWFWIAWKGPEFYPQQAAVRISYCYWWEYFRDQFGHVYMFYMFSFFWSLWFRELIQTWKIHYPAAGAIELQLLWNKDASCRWLAYVVLHLSQLQFEIALQIEKNTILKKLFALRYCKHFI